MKENLKSKALALDSFFKAMKTLRDEGILINKKDFTCQIGEWLVEMLYDGRRATSGVQKGWGTVHVRKHVQVKADGRKQKATTTDGQQ